MNTPKHTVLVAEDEKGLREAVTIYLETQGYEVIPCANGKIAYEEFLKRPDEIHLGIFDIMMPVMDGLNLIKEIRKTEHDFPIIILSAKSAEVDKINGLTIGADDYLSKPFSSMELLARVKVQIRRYQNYLDMKNRKDQPDDSLITNRDLALNPVTKKVTVFGNPVHLTPKEFQILELLMRHPERVYSAAEIYELVWKEDAISTETITVHIRKLREKIEEDPKKPQYIQVVWGLGYKMRKDPRA